ncbi:DUF3303 family protein [Trujillonella humicola]|uniref:DUF3303 family protein n=1 Tax=Trujillonella humicola TaxID=3383699 RepID=UPI0039059651
MRMMLKAVVDTESGNRAMADGTVEKTIQETVERLRPEAIYFVGDEGRRSLWAVIDLDDSARLPEISEPLFQLGARVTVTPCMNLEDLQRAMSALR